MANEGDAASTGDAGDRRDENASERFDRLPATGADRRVEDRPTREAVLAWWNERFGIAPEVFDPYTFWERGAGKVWAFRGDLDSPVKVEGLGMTFLRTRREHWKPTLEAVQRFGDHAEQNVVHLDRDAATEFVAGRDQDVEWDGDWGYLIVRHDVAGEPEPLGVGLYVYGELRSQVPKGRRREL